MKHSQPSRRHLLKWLWAGLLGWLWLGMPQGQAARSDAKRKLAPRSRSPFPAVTTYIYDGQNRLVRTEQRQATASPFLESAEEARSRLHEITYDPLTGVTSYAYDG